MTDNIPDNITERLFHFRDEVTRHFSFLSDYGFIQDNIESGRTKNFLDYFFVFKFCNAETTISISFSTDIINGNRTAFPTQEQRPVVDSQITCFISDTKAFMSIHSFAKTKFQDLPTDIFTIPLKSESLKDEITRVILNYSNFFQDNLSDVLRKEKIYDCYTDRFYDKVFKEINYSDKI